MQLVLPATSVFGDEESGKWPFKAYVQMLANNNISASRVITKMQFDIKASVPRLLFSPMAPVEAEDLDTLARQGKSDAAEKAIKLTVFQQDGGEEVVEVAQPVFTSNQSVYDKLASEVVSEPVVREAPVTAAAASPDAAAVINKWKKK
jgi:aryl-alcohol dehydrogenase-like predicted oxidoreductase